MTRMRGILLEPPRSPICLYEVEREETVVQSLWGMLMGWAQTRAIVEDTGSRKQPKE